MLSTDTSGEFSPTPLLDAFENFRGSFFDLDCEARISADALKKLKAGMSREMTQRGVTSGDRLMMALPNGARFAAVWGASLEVGASPVLMHGETPEAELTRAAERWNARFIVSEVGDFERGAEGRELRWRTVNLKRVEKQLVVSVPLHPTSGTSGGPKIAVRPGPCAVAEPQHYIETLGIDQSDVILCMTPMSHAYAYGICFVVSLLTSAELLFMRRFNLELVRNAIDSKRVTVLPAVPVIFEALLAEETRPLLGRPRVLLSAGALLLKKTYEAFRERFGLAIQPLYGTTETGGIAIGSIEDGLDESVGCPMRGVEVDIRALDERDSGRAGVLRVRSSSMMAGYLDEEGISPSALNDGWFETGDLAQLDATGRIHLQGRLSEVINIFGMKVLPHEVEEVIRMLEDVAEVKVYGPRWKGQEVVEAAVVCKKRITEDEILAHCDRHLVSYKCPTAIRFVDALPKTSSGKIAVRELSVKS